MPTARRKTHWRASTASSTQSECVTEHSLDHHTLLMTLALALWRKQNMPATSFCLVLPSRSIDWNHNSLEPSLDSTSACTYLYGIANLDALLDINKGSLDAKHNVPHDR